MNKQIFMAMATLAFASFLLVGAVSTTEAKSYKVIIKTTFYGDLNCVAQKADEYYFRVTDNVKNSDGRHNDLIGKGTIEPLGDYLKSHNGIVKSIITFDPNKFNAKYRTHLMWIREYYELFSKDVLIKNEYKYQKFDLARTTYSFNHGVKLGC